jgi:hypothetical protein
MKKTDILEKELLNAYERGELVSERPTKAGKDKFKAAAQATFVKDIRGNKMSPVKGCPLLFQ